LEIDLTEIKYKQMIDERIAKMEEHFSNIDNGVEMAATSIGIMPTSGHNIPGVVGRPYLSEAERIHLDMILVRTMKKYNSAMTDCIDMIDVPVFMTMNEAIIQASSEHEVLLKNRIEQINHRTNRRKENQEMKLARIQKQFDERVARINTDAQNRGMITSTIVLSQIENATQVRDKAVEAVHAELEFIVAQAEFSIEQLELQAKSRIQVLAKRIHTENARMNLQVVRERSVQKSRAFRDWISFQQIRLATPINTQILVDNEVHDLYLEFLIHLDSQRAIFLVEHDPLFLINMSQTTFNRLIQKLRNRGVFRHIPREGRGG